MKKLSILVLFTVFHFSSFAQTQVNLKDGSNNVISSHVSIQEAYDDIPATLTQSYVIEIDSSYNTQNEVFPISFINKTGASATNTITVKLAPNALVEFLSVDTSVNPVMTFDNADWIIIDGSTNAPEYEQMGGLVFMRYDSITPNPLVEFTNGSSNNTFKKCFFPVASFFGGIHVRFGGTNIAEGNSDNTIENCLFANSTLSIVSEGSVTSPNRNLVFRNNQFPAINDYGIWLKQGTRKVIIENNNFLISALQGAPAVSAILVDDLTDTLLIRNNHINIANYYEPIPQSGIKIANASGNNYCSITNNFIFNQPGIVYGTLLGPERSADAKGIVLSGTGALKADIYNNTVHMWNAVADTIGTSGQIASAAFEKLNNNPSSVYNIKNNLFINDRTGGVNGALHVAANIPSTAGTWNIDYNTYTSATGNLIRYNGPVFNNITTYANVMGGGNELHSNSENVTFAGLTDFHLYGTSVNNNNLQGVLIAGVTTDKEGDARVFPYRGADEYVINCTASPEAGDATLSSLHCDKGTLTYAPAVTNGKHFQWQSRLAGSGASFVNIPGANMLTIIEQHPQPMEYRVVDSCLAGGAPSFSDTLLVDFAAPVQISSISQTHNGLSYNFSSDALYATTYSWTFGDGDTSTSANPQHTYAADGNYTVTLIVANHCTVDTVTLNLNTLSVKGLQQELSEIKIYPNPSANNVHVLSKAGMEQVEVYDIMGKLVYNRKVDGQKETMLNITTLTNGIYTIKVLSGGIFYYSALSVVK